MTTFSTALRGYDRDEVDAYVARLQAELAALRGDHPEEEAAPPLVPITLPVAVVPLPPPASPAPEPDPAQVHPPLPEHPAPRRLPRSGPSAGWVLTGVLWGLALLVVLVLLLG